MPVDIEFSRKLIRGKIAEVVFEQMIREEGRYTVIPFGYEHTLPMLAQYRNLAKIKQVMDNISDAPDFALISEDKTEVFLVEVKYQSKMDIELVKKYAAKLMERWNPSWIFVATPSGFYCAPCSAVAQSSEISKFSSSWVAEDRQAEYLKLLNEFRCA